MKMLGELLNENTFYAFDWFTKGVLKRWRKFQKANFEGARKNLKKRLIFLKLFGPNEPDHIYF